MEDRYFTVKTLAAYLCVSESTVHRLKNNKMLPFTKIGGSIRFDVSEIQRWEKRQRVVKAS